MTRVVVATEGRADRPDPGMPRTQPILVGRYRIEHQLTTDEGHHAYRAVDQILDRPVIIKVLPDQHSANPDELARFRREARAIALLNHPNICAVFDFGIEAGSPFVVMEFVPADSVRVMALDGRLPLTIAVKTACEACLAIEAAAGHEGLHVDVTADNVFLTPEGAKLSGVSLDRASGEARTEIRRDRSGVQDVGRLLFEVLPHPSVSRSGLPEDRNEEVQQFRQIAVRAMADGYSSPSELRLALESALAADVPTTQLDRVPAEDQPPESGTSWDGVTAEAAWLVALAATGFIVAFAIAVVR